MSGRSLSFPAARSIPGQDLSSVDLQSIGSSHASNESAAAPRAHASAFRTIMYTTVKRGIDIVASLAAILVLSPFLAVFALIIKRQDGGSILYTHTRVGKNGRQFQFYKFRSMIRDADRLKDQLASLNQHADPRTFKMKDDPRITPFGRILRRYSLDELPQFFNVLKGDMSLVGPRPPLPREVALYSPEDMRRLEVTPGLTCLWQIRGRGNLPFEEQVKLDVEYIERRSLRLDFEILAQTLPAVMSGRGAY